MPELRWEWTGPSGARVVATLDPGAGTESVHVDGALVSSGARGSKTQGHVVAGEGVVSFDPSSPICILRDEGGVEVLPTKWPTSTRASAASAPPGRAPSAPPSPGRAGLATGARVVAAALALGVLVVLGYRALARRPDAPGALSYRAPNGLFVAHYPASFVAKPAVLPAPMSGLVLEDEHTGEAVVLAATPEDDGSRDTWTAQRRVHVEVLSSAPRADGTFEERARRDEACHGVPGAVVIGRVKGRRGEPAKLWSCTFLHGGATYTAIYVTREPALPEPEARLRRVIDAMELTRLADLSDPRR